MHDTTTTIPTVKSSGRTLLPLIGEEVRSSVPPSLHDVRHNRAQWEGGVAISTAAGDLLVILLGFVLAFWLREQSGLIFPVSSDLPMPAIWPYWRLILFGTGAVFAGFLSKGLYAYQDLLFPDKIVGRVCFVLTLCLFAFIGIGLAVRPVPPISRGFVVFAWFFILLTVFGWRWIVSRMLRHPALLARLRRRLVVVGAGPETVQIRNQLKSNLGLEFVGWVQGNRPDRSGELENCHLGSLHELGDILKRYVVDVAVLTESESLQREGVTHVARVCEREHVQFKMVPHFFEIMVSGLRPSVVGGVAVLGVESLPLNAYENRIVKRTVDIVGAVVGLLVSSPLIAIFGGLVFLESPGPVFYRQSRMGRHGRLFPMIKIRSMRPDAETDGKPRWACEDDPRRLRIGAFMRRWNIDEIPQFWNVLTGDMSLVGPRPERPELIEHFKFSVPHYQTRHSCRPGMTGWAQVNGLRGNTSLEERIRADIWYVENWTVFLDCRIMAHTLIRQENAY